MMPKAMPTALELDKSETSDMDACLDEETWWKQNAPYLLMDEELKSSGGPAGERREGKGAESSATASPTAPAVHTDREEEDRTLRQIMATLESIVGGDACPDGANGANGADGGQSHALLNDDNLRPRNVLTLADYLSRSQKYSRHPPRLGFGGGARDPHDSRERHYLRFPGFPRFSRAPRALHASQPFSGRSRSADHFQVKRTKATATVHRRKKEGKGAKKISSESLTETGKRLQDGSKQVTTEGPGKGVVTDVNDVKDTKVQEAVPAVATRDFIGADPAAVNELGPISEVVAFNSRSRRDHEASTTHLDAQAVADNIKDQQEELASLREWVRDSQGGWEEGESSDSNPKRYRASVPLANTEVAFGPDLRLDMVVTFWFHSHYPSHSPPYLHLHAPWLTPHGIKLVENKVMEKLEHHLGAGMVMMTVLTWLETESWKFLMGQSSDKMPVVHLDRYCRIGICVH